MFALCAVPLFPIAWGKPIMCMLLLPHKWQICHKPFWKGIQTKRHIHCWRPGPTKCLQLDGIGGGIWGMDGSQTSEDATSWSCRLTSNALSMMYRQLRAALIMMLMMATSLPWSFTNFIQMAMFMLLSMMTFMKQLLSGELFMCVDLLFFFFLVFSLILFLDGRSWQMGFSAGSCSAPQFSWVWNITNHKLPKGVVDELDYQSSSIFTLFWNLCCGLLPGKIMDDFNNFFNQFHMVWLSSEKGAAKDLIAKNTTNLWYLVFYLLLSWYNSLL